jgi:cytochrome oxidase Cu insertion factor (SCO1/SenC/PrrC family)
VLVLILSGILVAASGVQAEEAPAQPMIDEVAPAFSLETVSGDTLDLDTLKGQIVVIHFAASW